MSDRRILTTDPDPLPADERCPKCNAGPERRGPSGGFGIPTVLCLTCGHNFGVEWRK